MNRLRTLMMAVPALVAAMPAMGVEHTVRMAGMSFQPASLEARVGDVLRFVNDDSVPHNILVPTVGFGTDLGLQKPGQDAELPLLKAGSFEVECVVHAHMSMKVTVKE